VVIHNCLVHFFQIFSHFYFSLFFWFFSNLVGEEGPRIQGVKGSSECKRLDKDDINTCVFFALTS